MNEQVARGIALLDERGPTDWRKRINLDTLDVGSLENCILGQLYGSFLRKPSSVFWDTVNCGFDVPMQPRDEEYVAAYVELTRAWRDALTVSP